MLAQHWSLSGPNSHVGLIKLLKAAAPTMVELNISKPAPSTSVQAVVGRVDVKTVGVQVWSETLPASASCCLLHVSAGMRRLRMSPMVLLQLAGEQAADCSSCCGRVQAGSICRRRT